ncbi:nitroreductase [Fontibacillus solani]|uniref:Nitroreductase n=1 Tax=Fontibacillus solani TaxID=1572857 RepID=A0A7W3SR79_9BACL|nr:nitroreductase family protein [Fontibacillus solani]MBA9084731.1 nitroreductase [Fontibacillus solani]
MSVKETLDLNNFYTVLEERHSVRAYDPSVKISREEITELLEIATSAPSSSNLQPWRFLVIDQDELKKKLLPIASNQQQVVEAAAIIAVLGDLKSYEQAEVIYSKAVEAGYMSKETKAGFVERLNQLYGNLGPERLHHINLLDGGLVSMQLMLAAKAKGYDTVPMGGYNTERFVQEFAIPNTLKPIVLIAIGKASKPGHPTARLDVNEITYWNSI